MTSRDPLDDRIRGFLTSEAPDRAPDRLRDLVDARLNASRQTPRGWWRSTGSVRQLGLVAAVAALIVIIAAAVLGPGRSLDETPTQTPGATPSPAAPTASPAATPDGIALPPGSNRSARFSPRIEFSVPIGWTKTVDLPAMLVLVPPDAGSMVQRNEGTVEFDGITIYADPVAGPADGGSQPEPGVGRDAEALSNWLAARPQLDATAPVPAAIGGLSGFSVDYSVNASAGGLCGVLCINVFNMADGIQAGVLEGEVDQALILDRPGGGTLLILIEDADGREVEALRAEVGPVVDSVRLVPAT